MMAGRMGDRLMLLILPATSNVVLQKMDRQNSRCSRMGSENGKGKKKETGVRIVV